MAVQLVLNFIIAVFWLFVTNSYTTNNFVLGFIFGLVLVYLLHRVLPGRFYVITLYRIVKLVIIFLIELIKANFDVLKIIIKPSIKNRTGILCLPHRFKKRLANCLVV
ncbi:cation:proton antiporter [Staphylococcus aureus subsp. aureus ST 1413]|nr:cation:proton antiporter [Staphylococcus aureus subsp. aureus ST 1413]